MLTLPSMMKCMRVGGLAFRCDDLVFPDLDPLALCRKLFCERRAAEGGLAQPIDKASPAGALINMGGNDGLLAGFERTVEIWREDHLRP
jgi:hypothetical protein